MKNLIVISLVILQFHLVSCNYCSRKSTSELDTVILEDSKEMIEYQPILVTDSLSDKVNEQSGLVCYQGLFWVNNDSDCAPSLYAYNKDGALKKELIVSNYENVDWEDVTDDKDYIYIGDFGNNFGVRKNLRVLQIPKAKIDTQEISTVAAREMPIVWDDQTVFEPRKQKHDFDCEAFVSYGDSLYFFSKNWADYKTRMYVASKELKGHKLKVRAEFDADLLVTGADLSSDGKVLALVGYKDYRSYVLLFSAYKGTEFFSGKSLRLDLSSLGGAQTEAIVFDDNDDLFISTEETNQPQALYQIEWRKWAK